jgi:hypothetical protein
VLQLDYVSCFLTVVSTILVARKMWLGLVIAAVNSVVICVIGANTAQYGFIVANIFCIFTYLLNIRSWVNDRKAMRDYRDYMNEAVLEGPSHGVRFQPTTKQFLPASGKAKGLYLAYNARAISSTSRNVPTQQQAQANGVLVETGN